MKMFPLKPSPGYLTGYILVEHSLLNGFHLLALCTASPRSGAAAGAAAL